MRQDFEIKFKKALDFLKNSDINSPNKPVVPHDVRVGEYLYEKGYDGEVVEAGILHDMLEWSSVSEKELLEKFGNRVLDLVKVNSKDRSITDSYKRKVDMIERCKKIGDDAFAIKIADNFDSFVYYSGTKNEKGLERSKVYTKLLLENLSDSLKKIFLEDLEEILG